MFSRKAGLMLERVSGSAAPLYLPICRASNFSPNLSSSPL